MKIAITGGTGFVGRHLAQRLVEQGHQVVTLSRRTDPSEPIPGITHRPMALSNVETLADAFEGCDAVAHCAGINREIGAQTYQAIHIDGTRNVVAAARRSGVHKIVLLSFLRARPNCGSAYHESKWAAEEIVRQSGLNYTILKPGMMYGRGDHMLHHLSHTLHTIPLFMTVGCVEQPIAPLAIDDATELLSAILVDGRLPNATVPVTGTETLLLSDAVRRVARVLGKRVAILPAPVWLHYTIARLFEWTMKVPLEAIAQVRILAEGVTTPTGPRDPLPADLRPRLVFDDTQIRRGLPAPGAFGRRDLRCAT